MKRVETVISPVKEGGWHRWFRYLLRGAGQVMFQKSAWCGFFFLVGIFWGAWSEGRPEVAWGALVGLLVATVTGTLLKLEPDDGSQGLWGFNGILVGCGMMTFLRPTLLVWLALILCSATTVWVRRGMNRVMAPWKINSLTMPFVLMTWFFLLASRLLEGMPVEGLSTPMLPMAESPTLHMTPRYLLFGWLKGIAQVFLINSWVTGILFLVGLLIANRWAAFWAAIASAVAMGVALLFRAPGASVVEGLYGFSPVLTGVALGAIFYSPSWRSALWSLAGILVTVFVQAGFNVLLEPVGLPSLTAPFCITTWLFLLPMFKLERHPHKSPFLPEADHSDWSTERKPHLP